MTIQNMKVEKTITLGNILEIIIILVISVMAFTKVQSDVSTLEQNQKKLEQRHHQFEQHVGVTYMRQDVFQEILNRLESIDRNLNGN